MIICPNCNHQNPEASVRCESCYAPLPSTSPCPNCGAMVQLDATFCGQCGFNLQNNNDTVVPQTNGKSAFGETDPESLTATKEFSAILQEEPTGQAIKLGDLDEPLTADEQIEDISENSLEDDDLEAWLASMQEDSAPQTPETLNSAEEIPGFSEELAETPTANLEPNPSNSPELSEELAETPVSNLEPNNAEEASMELSATGETSPVIPPETSSESSQTPNLYNSQVMTNSVNQQSLTTKSKDQSTAESATPVGSKVTETTSILGGSSTRLQLQKATLTHAQTGLNIEIPLDLDIVRIGKPNSQVPPDIDVSGFPNAEIVSRVHAEIRIEGDTYFVEDRGSSNGTYINHSPLLTGNRHRLRQGDRVSLGKGDLISFVFQVKQVQ